MIGNDIVDLKLAKKQSDWRRKGFLEKVFSLNEQAMIFDAAEPDVIVWELWSMKESAYKAVLRVRKEIRINPKDFDCLMLNEHKGMVKYGEEVYHTVSEINQDFVHTQACSITFDARLFSKVLKTDQSCLDSNQLYHTMISAVAVNKGCDMNDMVIRKNRLGIPELYMRGKKMPVLCSLSHHGRYGSYLINA